MKQQLLLAAALVLTSIAAPAADFAGRVVGVIDGDTIDVLSPHMDRQRVRLVAIDAPERGQPFGTRAKQALSDMVYGMDVHVSDHGKDIYGRQLGEVMLGQASANKAMVHLGLAWAYRPKLTDRIYLEIEDKARRERRGLWIDQNPVAPWDFRRQKRSLPVPTTAPNQDIAQPATNEPQFSRTGSGPAT